MPPTRIPHDNRRLLIFGFIPVVLIVLGFDSRAVWQAGFNGQIVSNLVAPLYLGLILFHLKAEQRLTVLIFVPFAAVAEYLFSLIFRLYTYKFDAVPPYVPFGHAILLSTGLLIAETALVRKHERGLRFVLLGVQGVLFGTALIFQDSLSAILGVVFALILVRKRGQILYLVMSLLVLYIELLGTAVGCWTWHPTVFRALHTTNPPLGAFVLYVIGDVLVLRFTRMLRPILGRLQTPSRLSLALAWIGLESRAGTYAAAPPSEFP